MSAVPEVILQFDEPFRTELGEVYRARVIGQETPLGQWEGWLEFAPLDSSHTPFATEQSMRSFHGHRVRERIPIPPRLLQSEYKREHRALPHRLYSIPSPCTNRVRTFCDRN